MKHPRGIKLKRTLDPTKEQHVILKPNPQQIAIINRLLAAGLHGNTAAQVVARVLCEGLGKYVP